MDPSSFKLVRHGLPADKGVVPGTLGQRFCEGRAGGFDPGAERFKRLPERGDTGKKGEQVCGQIRRGGGAGGLRGVHGFEVHAEIFDGILQRLAGGLDVTKTFRGIGFGGGVRMQPDGLVQEGAAQGIGGHAGTGFQAEKGEGVG